MRKHLAVLALALGTLALTAPPVSAAEAGGSVFGTLWFDENEDGIRQPGEPPVINRTVVLDNMFVAVTETDVDGNYRFDDVRPGPHRVGAFTYDETYTKPGGDSVFDPFTMKTGDIEVADGVASGPHNGGLIPARPDVAVSKVEVPGELPPVGSEVEIAVTFQNRGNTGEALYGSVLLPDGLTPVSTDAPVPWIDGQRIRLSSMYQAWTRQGESVTYTVVAQVDAEVLGGHYFVQAEHQRDVNPKDNLWRATIRV